MWLGQFLVFVFVEFVYVYVQQYGAFYWEKIVNVF